MTDEELSRVERFVFVNDFGKLRCPFCHAESLGPGFHDQRDWLAVHSDACVFRRLVAEVRRLRLDVGAFGPWHPADQPPNHNGPVWVYLPAVGNDDDGYGHVEIARWIHPLSTEHIGGHWPHGAYLHGGWLNEHGSWLHGETAVAHWRSLIPPEPPLPRSTCPPRS